VKSYIRNVIVTSAASAVLCATANNAAAQSASQKPFRGSSSSSTAPGQTLDLTLGVTEAYDDNLLADTVSINPEAPAVGGFYTMFTADAAYTKRGKRSQFGATGGAVSRYYNQDSQTTNTSASAGVGFSTELGRRTTLFANQTAAYSPSYLYGLFPSITTVSPGDAVPVAPDYAVNNSASYHYGSVVSLTQGLTRRGTLTTSANYQYTNYVEETLGQRDLSAYEVRAEFSHGVSRNASLKVGYHYRSGNFGYGLIGANATTTEHGVDVGMDYTKPLSPTRRFVFGFSVGSSAAAAPFLDNLAVIDGTQYRMSGDMSAGYQFKRTWEARGSYRRGLDYVPELSGPVYTDGVTAAINGMLSRSVSFSSAVAYSTGDAAVFTSAAKFDTYTFSTRVGRTISKSWSVYGEYLYYFYDFGKFQVRPGVPSTMERNGVRGGLTVGLPVIRR